MFTLTAICPDCRQSSTMRLVSASGQGTLWLCTCEWGCGHEIEGHRFVHPQVERRIIEEHKNDSEN
jgi:hypothetical protein